MTTPARRRRHFFAAFLFVAHALGIASSLDALMSVRTDISASREEAMPSAWATNRKAAKK